MGTIALNDRLTAQFVATAGQTAFPADFPVVYDRNDAPAGLFLRRVRAGVETILAHGSGWTATAITADDFTATLDAGSLVGDKVQIFSSLPPERDRAHTPGGATRTDMLERDALWLQAQLQEHWRDLQRAILVPLGEAGITFPDAATRAGNLFEFDEDGAPVANRSVDDVTADAVQQAIEATAALLAGIAAGLSGEDLSLIVSSVVEAVTAAGVTNVTLVNNAGSTQIAAIDAAGTAQVDAIQDAAAQLLPIGFAVDSGAANAAVVNFTPADEPIVKGVRIAVEFSFDQTGPCTLKINAAAPLAIKGVDLGDPPAGSFLTGVAYDFLHMGTHIQLISPSSFVPEVGGAAGTWTNGGTVTGGWRIEPDGWMTVWLKDTAPISGEVSKTYTFPAGKTFAAGGPDYVAAFVLNTDGSKYKDTAGFQIKAATVNSLTVFAQDNRSTPLDGCWLFAAGMKA